MCQSVQIAPLGNDAAKLAKSTVRASLKRLIAAKTAMLTGTTDNDAKLYAKNAHARA